MRISLFVSFLVSAVVCLAVPWLAARTLQKRWGVTWRVVGRGALVFLLFDLLTRQPLLRVAEALLSERLQASASFRLAWLVVVAVTAGLFQEIGRCVGYRWWIRDARGWMEGAAFGVGQGGAETFVIGGLGNLAAGIGYLAYTLFGTEARVPAGMEQTLATARHVYATVPAGTPILNAVESLASLPVQVALSLMVLRVFTGGGPFWLAAAIGCHAVWELATALATERGGPPAGVAVAAGFAVLSVGLILRWRPAVAAAEHRSSVPL
jgi:uncharacterized membrane protein YhfC